MYLLGLVPTHVLLTPIHGNGRIFLMVCQVEAFNPKKSGGGWNVPAALSKARRVAYDEVGSV